MSDLMPPYAVTSEPFKRRCEHCRLDVVVPCKFREQCENWPPAKSEVTPPVLAPHLRMQTEGVKHDTGKPRLELLSRVALEAEARVLAFGADKYAADNWRKGMSYRRLIGAAMRHLLAFQDGEDTDPETRESHLAHLRCCAGFLIEYQELGLGTDDRHRWVP